MTKEEAKQWIDLIKRKYIHGGDEEFDYKRKIALDMAIEALEKESKTDWIPVSERLPKEEKRVLLSLAEYACEDDERVSIGCRVLKPWVEQGDEYVWVVEGFSVDFEDDEVEAWMPLPEPYKVGGGET